MITGEITIAIDPKLTGSGYAIALGRTVIACGIARVPRATRDLEGRIEYQVAYLRREVRRQLAACVVEFPVVYPGARSVGDPNDIVRLAGLACGIAGALCADRLVLPRPRDWKGALPKDVHHARLALAHPKAVARARKSAPASLQHDVLDAIGLCYWYLDSIHRGE